jgi:hypothetical protein
MRASDKNRKRATARNLQKLVKRVIGARIATCAVKFVESSGGYQPCVCRNDVPVGHSGEYYRETKRGGEGKCWHGCEIELGEVCYVGISQILCESCAAKYKLGPINLALAQSFAECVMREGK